MREDKHLMRSLLKYYRFEISNFDLYKTSPNMMKNQFKRNIHHSYLYLFQKRCWLLIKIVSSRLKSDSSEFHTSSQFPGSFPAPEGLQGVLSS